jgi:divalent metal cation (Fe/Co/Zn/Cd) transporter
MGSPSVTIPSETARLLGLATSASVATAALLIAAKLAAWLATGSVSVLASLVDSAMDAGASLVNLVAVRLSLRPADAEHRFGHGKAQPRWHKRPSSPASPYSSGSRPSTACCIRSQSPT